VAFTEHNAWHGESWRFWLQVDGNEDALARLAVYLEHTGSGTYVLEPTPVVTEAQARDVVEHNTGGVYMPAEQMVEGRMQLLRAAQILDVSDPLDDVLYKGRIDTLFRVDGA
jgi:hypothetical protein